MYIGIRKRFLSLYGHSPRSIHASQPSSNRLWFNDPPQPMAHRRRRQYSQTRPPIHLLKDDHEAVDPGFGSTALFLMQASSRSSGPSPARWGWPATHFPVPLVHETGAGHMRPRSSAEGLCRGVGSSSERRKAGVRVQGVCRKVESLQRELADICGSVVEPFESSDDRRAQGIGRIGVLRYAAG